MNVDDLINQMRNLVSSDAGARQLKNALKEIDDFQLSGEWLRCPPRSQDELNKLRNQIENIAGTTPDDENVIPDILQASFQPAFVPHKPEAVKLFNEAVAAFQNSDYELAESKCREVLNIPGESNYQSVKSLLKTLESYRDENIAVDKLPRGVREPYKAAEQNLLGIDSRLTAKDFPTAQKLVSEAGKKLDEAYAEYTRVVYKDVWKEADELRTRIGAIKFQVEQAELAQNHFNKASQFFKQGDIDNAIQQAEQANEIQRKAEFEDSANSWKKFKKDIEEVTRLVKTGDTLPEDLAKAYQSLIHYQSKKEYQSNPSLTEPLSEVEHRIPDAIKALIGEKQDGSAGKIRGKIDVIRYARQIRPADESLASAKQMLKTLGVLGHNQTDLRVLIDSLGKEIEELQIEIDNYKETLSTVRKLVAESKYAQAKEVGQKLFARFPEDPLVQSNKSEVQNQVRSEKAQATGHLLLNVAKYGGIVVLALMLLCAGTLGIGAGWRWISATATPTNTPVPTLTPEPTLTRTPVPPVPTSPLPPTGYVRRNIWTRNGCYNTYTATGWVLAGTAFKAISNEVHTDENGDICYLIETVDHDNKGVTGWARKKDLTLNP